MSDPNERLTEVLKALQDMFIEAGGGGRGHPHLDALLDPASRSDARTLNYLVATASGTLQDRIFTPGNHDHLADGNFEAFNRRYKELLAEAVQCARELELPAAGVRAVDGP